MTDGTVVLTKDHYITVQNPNFVHGDHVDYFSK